LRGSNSWAATPSSSAISYDLTSASPNHRFDPDDFNIVGIYDFDWLVTPEFERMLDLAVSSPSAIGGVRAFGIFTMGEREDLAPGTGGVVWTDLSSEPDFSLPFAALEQLVKRGLTPFISLGFFPPAVSASPIAPPDTLDNWQYLIRSFFEALITDNRFGAETISRWSFEVWNEPNEGRFWSGSFEQYLDLYRATSEAIANLGLDIRLGGPAMAYKPESETEDGPETMSRFLEFLRDDPSLRCNFVSYHRKGTVDSSAPDPGRLRTAALEISGLIEAIVPARSAEIVLINNEADEKIGFEVPYLPRMDHFAASWLTTLVTAHTALSAGGRRFSAVQDNANLQLMQAPFDGRRSIYSFLDSGERGNLVKTSGAVWYDLLPLLSGFVVQPGATSGLFPDTAAHAMVSVSESGIAVLTTWHPAGESAQSSFTTTISLAGIPWRTVNVVGWRIDADRSNAYAASLQLAGASEGRFTDADAVVIRRGQELTLVGPVSHSVLARDGRLSLDVALGRFDVLCYWITPTTTDPVRSPSRVFARSYKRGVEISWDPVTNDQLLGYEIARNGEVIAGPIRPCSWIDSISSEITGYAVRAVTASGTTGRWTSAEPI
jgi:hypothetical protein